MTDWINELSEGSGIPLEQINAEKQALYDDIRGKIYPGEEITEEQRDEIRGIVISRMRALYRGKLASNPFEKEFEAIIFGANDKRDFANDVWKEIIAEYKANPSETLAKDKVRLEGEKVIPLRWAKEEDKASMADWQLKQLGKDMPESQIQRTALTVVKDEEGKWKEAFFKIRDRNVDVPLPMFTKTGFRALKTTASTDDLLALTDSKELKFETTEKLPEKDILDLLKNGLAHRNIKLANIEDWASKKKKRDYAVFYGNVMEIDIERMSSDARPLKTIKIEDSSIGWRDSKGNVTSGVTVFLPQHVTVDFPEGSEIYVIGVPKVNRERGNNISAYGIYVPAYCRTSLPLKKNVEGEDRQGASIPKIPEKTDAVPSDDEW